MDDSLETIEAYRASGEVKIEEFHPAWKEARPVTISHYWSGAAAPEERHATSRIIWNDKALTVRFECRQHEPLVVGDERELESKTIGLWERDVCEMFIAPDERAPHRYFEFEASPLGEWLDIAIHITPEGIERDWEYHSGMKVATHISRNQIIIAMQIGWHAFGRDRAPEAGERWRANLFRCVGSDPVFRYLAWRPTETTEPNFHVPEAFGWIVFK